ncbi:PEP-CTERM sorting domain-containing protein [Ideonella sp. BN130291]|uniref:PEP-CTERM sorting domain-containing protein n=1 Tax=Ideonella sp. BN130291 TaxID=3112940 RepID=UPI002E26DAD5|nr:PEP-CTERM sorting domain-containing protein [Ideonella sp. BN130291]
MKPLAIRLATALSLLVAGAAQAALVPTAPIDLHGTGVGAVNTVLTLQGHRRDGTENGSVGLTAAGELVIGGDAKKGASQTQLLSLDSLGLTSAENLRIVFNANEPGGSGITLSDLVLTIYSPTGGVLFNTTLAAQQVFSTTTQGIGQPDAVFALDATSILAAQSAAFSGNFGANLIGLSAGAHNAQGGFETFFIANVATPPVPEPQTYLLLLAGLGVIGGLVWRRSTARQ